MLQEGLIDHAPALSAARHALRSRRRGAFQAGKRRQNCYEQQNKKTRKTNSPAKAREGSAGSAQHSQARLEASQHDELLRVRVRRVTVCRAAPPRGPETASPLMGRRSSGGGRQHTTLRLDRLGYTRCVNDVGVDVFQHGAGFGSRRAAQGGPRVDGGRRLGNAVTRFHAHVPFYCPNLSTVTGC